MPDLVRENSPEATEHSQLSVRDGELLPRPRFGAGNLPPRGRPTNFKLPPSTEAAVSAKRNPRLVGRLNTQRNRNTGHIAALTREHSISHSSTQVPSHPFTFSLNRPSIQVSNKTPAPAPNQAFNLVTNQSSNPLPSQSSGRNDGASTPPRKICGSWLIISHGSTGRSITGSSVSSENLAAYVQLMEDSRKKSQGQSRIHCLAPISNTFFRSGTSNRRGRG